jgi:threonine aldolase
MSEYAACADTVMVSFSKGLGAPVGAALAGTTRLMEEAWNARKRLGGGLRQSGVIAAAALFGIDNHRDRLSIDHANAARFAKAVDGAGRARVVPPDTNIVMVDLPASMPAEETARRAAIEGVLISVWTASRIRVVTHLDASTEDVDEAARVLRGVLERG